MFIAVNLAVCMSFITEITEGRDSKKKKVQKKCILAKYACRVGVGDERRYRR